MAASKYEIIRSSHVRTFEMTAIGATSPLPLQQERTVLHPAPDAASRTEGRLWLSRDGHCRQAREGSGVPRPRRQGRAAMHDVQVTARLAQKC
jgi:hypothetical protein